MLQLWAVLATVLVLALASVAFLRGLALLFVGGQVLSRLEALALVLAGVGGWAGAILAFRAT